MIPKSHVSGPARIALVAVGVSVGMSVGVSPGSAQEPRPPTGDVPVHARGNVPADAGARDHPTSTRATCTVERVVDGDTLRCTDGERVRLLLIDAPEMGDEPFGPLAAAELRGMTPAGTNVGLELDFERRDRYGRLLAHVHLPDGTWVNREMVRRGYAVPLVIPPNVRYVEEIRAAAVAARHERRGFWAVDFFEEPPVTGSSRSRSSPGAPPAPGDAAGGACDSSYPDVCIPPPPPDLDCRHVPHRRFRVVGPDPHRFDGNGDGVGCEGR